MLKKFPSDKISGTKNAFFLSRAPTHHRFTFNLRFLYELKHKVLLSKTVCGIFHFQFHFVLTKVFIFVQQNTWTFWLQNATIPFKTKIIENGLKKSIEVHFNRQKIFLLYFYEACNVNLWEKKFVRSTAYLCRTDVFIKCHHFVIKKQTEVKAKQFKLNIFKSMRIYGFS